MMRLVRNSFSYLFRLVLFLMGQKQIFCLFSFHSNNIPKLITVGFSGIRNRIVIMEGKHADCKATMIALEDLLENTHLLCKGKYNCTADLLFDSFGFKQSSEFVFIQHKEISLIKTNKTGGQLYSNTSPYKVSECFLDKSSLLPLSSVSFLMTSHFTLAKSLIMMMMQTPLGRMTNISDRVEV